MPGAQVQRHQLSKNVIFCGFGGIDENFVVSGSEDAKIYIWHRATGRLIETLSGHAKGPVNGVAWHPRDALTIASCGDDHTVRIWRPGVLCRQVRSPPREGGTRKEAG